jgi:hypothetical protein
MSARRFPPPWSVEEYNDACFVVRDHNGQALAYVLLGKLAIVREIVASAVDNHLPVIASVDATNVTGSGATTSPIIQTGRQSQHCSEAGTRWITR